MEAHAPEVLIRLEESGLGQLMRQSLWLYPAVEVVHILGFALVLISVLLFDARVLGRQRDLAVDDAGRLLLPAAWLGMGLAVVTGVMLLATQAASIGMQTVFWVKMGLVLLAGANALLFHGWCLRHLYRWNRLAPAPRRARAVAAVSMLGWLGVLVSGRLIAYL
ncbi:hypothetical protein [Thioalkalivibrio thiocyanodenitrificans]|uniref:hypothetical protein n=1 Tax=Thioalkalivibrio thiocyanodenitrificans TaxID=243063 RepID=UPI00036FF14E|nr:hypothetical protein [Thioalkalivibrio thiocyanodenitrificans]